MSKQSKKTKAYLKGERKLQQARSKFEAIQQQYLLVREQGKQQVEKAQLEAERQLTKVNEQVQKRAHTLSRAEERMLELRSGKGLAAAASDTGSAADGASITPSGVADAIEELQVQRSGGTGPNELTLPNSV